MNATQSPPRPDRSNVIIGGVVLFVIAVAVALWLIWPRPFGGSTLRYVAYFPGQTTVEKGTRLEFGRVRVGRVKNVVASQEGLQLTIVPVRVAAVPEVATLLVGRPASLDVGNGNRVDIALTALTRAVIRWNGDSITAQRTPAGKWTLTGYGRVLPVTLGGKPILPGGAGGQASLSPGDDLVFGADEHALQVYWGDVGFLTRVDLDVREGAFASAARKGGDSTGAIGPGTSVALLAGLGHPEPELELRPSLYHGKPMVNVPPPPPGEKGVDSVVAFELTPVVSVDPLALLESVASYIGTPAGLRQPASNRIERNINDFGVALASFSELSQQLNRAGKGEDPGVLLRLALDEQQMRSLAVLLGNAENISSHAASLAGTFDTGTRDPAARGRLLNQLLGAGYGSLLSTLDNADSASAQVSSILAGNRTRIDSTLRHVDRLTGTLARNDTAIDSTLHNVQAITTGVRNAGPRIDSTAAHARRAVRKAKIPVLAVVGTWLLAHIYSIVR